MTHVHRGDASRGWRRFGGATLLFVFLVAACASPAGSPATSQGPAGSPAGSPAVASAALPASLPSILPSPTPVPADLLAAALEPLRAGSSFETTVTVDGEVVVTAAGRSAGEASELSVTTGTRTVDYVRVPPGAWAREPGRSWVSVDAGAAPGAPLDTLSTPATLVVSTPDGSPASAVTFTATYLAATMGLTGDPVTVTITADGGAVTFTYQAEASGRAMTSTTTLRPSAGDPIAPPGS